jgi:hypothetical protein
MMLISASGVKALMRLIDCLNKHHIGVEISLSILHLLPVSLVSRFVGRKEGR